MIQWLETRAWQVGAIGGGVVALGLAVSLGVTHVQKIGLERDLVGARAEIEQLTGNLRTCRQNTRSLETGIGEANQKVRDAADAATARVAQAEREVAVARQATAATQARLNRLQSAPAVGSTVCERSIEVDRAIQEAFR